MRGPGEGRRGAARGGGCCCCWPGGWIVRGPDPSLDRGAVRGGAGRCGAVRGGAGPWQPAHQRTSRVDAGRVAALSKSEAFSVVLQQLQQPQQLQPSKIMRIPKIVDGLFVNTLRKSNDDFFLICPWPMGVRVATLALRRLRHRSPLALDFIDRYLNLESFGWLWPSSILGKKNPTSKCHYVES